MSDNQSSAAICCSESNERIHQLNSVRHIIFGWDRFNSITWLLLLLFFCIWCIGFFNMYEPKDDHHDHHDHHWNEEMHEKHREKWQKCKYFIIFNKKSVTNNNCKYIRVNIIEFSLICLNLFVYINFSIFVLINWNDNYCTVYW